jgi:hypothetical protein
VDIGLRLRGEDEGRRHLAGIQKVLTDGPHPDTEAFAAAVQTSDELEVDGDTVISRGDDGAFVMAWVYVTNEEAGVETPEEEHDN